MRNTVTVWEWWCIPVIPELGQLRQEECCKVEASLGYITSSMPAWATEAGLAARD